MRYTGGKEDTVPVPVPQYDYQGFYGHEKIDEASDPYYQELSKYYSWGKWECDE